MSVSQLTGYAGHKKGFHTNKATFFKQTLSSSNNEPGKIVIEIYLVVIFLFVNLNNRNKYEFMWFWLYFVFFLKLSNGKYRVFLLTVPLPPTSSMT